MGLLRSLVDSHRVRFGRGPQARYATARPRRARTDRPITAAVDGLADNRHAPIEPHSPTRLEYLTKPSTPPHFFDFPRKPPNKRPARGALRIGRESADPWQSGGLTNRAIGPRGGSCRSQVGVMNDGGSLSTRAGRPVQARLAR